MVISHKHKFIFVKTAKTAGTSIEVFLDKYCGDKDILTPFSYPEENHTPRNYRGLFNPFPQLIEYFENNMASRKNLKDLVFDTIPLKKFYHHIPAWVIKKRVSKALWNSYYKFTVERNPWDKVISGWFYYNKKYDSELTLDEYIYFLQRRMKLNVRGTGIFPYNYINYTDPKTEEVLVDRIIKYEKLNKQFLEVLNKLGIHSDKGLDVFAKKSSRKKRYTDFYTAQQKKLVGNLFQKEIDMHGYTFGD